MYLSVEKRKSEMDERVDRSELAGRESNVCIPAVMGDARENDKQDFSALPSELSPTHPPRSLFLTRSAHCTYAGDYIEQRRESINIYKRSYYRAYIVCIHKETRVELILYDMYENSISCRA